MRVLLIGYRGFIGSNLLRYLEDAGHEVIRYKGSIVDYKPTHKVDAVINLAAYGNDSSHNQFSMETYRVNFSGACRVLESFLETDGQKVFINAGSSSEYGTHNQPMSLDSTLRPTTNYAKSKASFSEYVQTVERRKDKRAHVVRIFSAYGPYEKENRLIPTAFRAIEKNEIFNLANGVHDFVYIDDVCETFLRVLEDDNAPTITHAASGVQYSNGEVIDMICKVTGKKMRVQKAKQMRSFDTNISWVSDKNSIYVPAQHTLLSGLEKTWQWRQKQS